MLEPKQVAVLGGGIMGAGIAGFFADRGYAVSMYDLSVEIARASLAKLVDPKAKIPLCLSPRSVERIRALPTSAMNEELKKADLLIEAVPEVMSIKRQGFAEVDKWRRPGSIIATNTSGLSVDAMVEGLSADLREHFLGIHFFNPVRYMALVEVIPGAATRPEVVRDVADLFTRAGKRPIVGKNTPNFVANRIGIFSLMWTLALASKYGLGVEEVDMVTGEALGRPKTGTFRLCDMVGIDTLYHAARNSFENCERDEQRQLFDPPAFITAMLERKMLGDKTGKGFYQKVKAAGGAKGGGGDDDGAGSGGGTSRILALNLDTLEYRPKIEPRANCIRYAKTHAKPADRIVAMMTYGEEDRVSRMAREIILGTAAYALARLGEVADDIPTIDNAIKWGFGHEVGPIEILDHLGLHRAMRMMEGAGIAVPPRLLEVANGEGRFYPVEPPPPPPRQLSLVHLRRTGKVVRENLSARLVDLGDGVLACELDAKMVPTMNPVDDYIISMMVQAHEEVLSGRFRALVIGNQATNFCSGAQIAMMLELAKRKRFDEIRQVSAMLQAINLGNRHAPFPVVVAPHGMTLGGGLEIALGGQARVAAAETYAGLVEVGVGLVPAGGGCLLMLLQLLEKMQAKNPGPMPPVMSAFELIGFAKVSSSAFDAQEKGIFKAADTVCFVKEEQLRIAKELALAKLEGFKQLPKQELILPGPDGYRVLADGIDGFVRQKKITPHSAKIAKMQAHILTGGPHAGPTKPVSEDELLELEREAFVELCAEPLTQERMAHMLKKGKPLIN